MEKYHAKHGNNEKYEYQFASIPQLIEGYGEWVQGYFDKGFRMYLVTFKFNHILGSSEYKRREMLKQVEYQFYPTLIKHVESWPMKPSRQCNLPILIGVPDLPVAKHTKKLSVRDVTINDGLHVHAIVAMPQTLRHPGGCQLKKLIREKQHHFIGAFTSISDIDVRRITDHPKYVADYALKNGKRNPAIMDEILILPKSPPDVRGYMSAISAAKIHDHDRLRRKISEMRNLWDRAAYCRRRSAFDDYMEVVLSLYRELKNENIAEQMSQRMLKLAKVPNRDKMNRSIERIIAATSNAHKTIASQMGLALLYGERQKWPDIKQGLRESGGLVGCVEKLEALEEKKKRSRRLDLAISKVLNVA
jgi:hypothetical protein